MDTEIPFDAFTDKVPPLPIKRLKELQRRAQSLVKGRKIEQQRAAVSTIRSLEQEYFYKEKEQWIQRQLDIGGSILRYLHPEDRTEYGLRDMEKYRPHQISSSEFDFPNETNTSALEALENSLELFVLDEQELPDALAFEYVAILALSLISQAVQSFRDNSTKWSESLHDGRALIHLEALANSVVDITEVVCRAEELKNHHYGDRRLKRLLAEKEEKLLPAMAEKMTKQSMSLSAAKAARARHEKEHGSNRTEALACWDLDGRNFSSKSAFARIKCRDYSVTERTLLKWITDHENKKAAT